MTKEREALDMIAKLQMVEQTMEAACKRIDELKAENKALKEALMSLQDGAQPELCKYGQEPKSCTSSPMDCQCALDATFAQSEQEPVGQLLEEAYGRGQVMWFNKPDDFSMLYTTPPTQCNCSQRPSRSDMTWVHATPWRGLTDEEANELVEHTECEDYYGLVEATEAKLKEKNTK